MLDDIEYHYIVDEILNDEEFMKLKSFKHHGISRYEHSLIVSYKAYKYAKKHNLDYVSVAKAGLLHDFFVNSDNPNMYERFITTFKHTKLASSNAYKQFGINELESNIIEAHMFPINTTLPKHKESWVVNLIDKKVSILDWLNTLKYKTGYVCNLFVLFLFNSLK